MPSADSLTAPNSSANAATPEAYKSSLAQEGALSEESQKKRARWWDQGEYDNLDRALSSEERMREEQDRLRAEQDAAQQREGVQIDYSQANQDYARQQGIGAEQSGLGDYYQNMLNGNGPSVAQLQMQQGVDASVAAQMSLANSARGGTMAAAGAQRNAANQGAAISQQAVNQSAQLRAQEQQAAAAGYQTLLANQRSAELQAMGMSAEQAQAQAQLEAQQRAQNDAMTQAYLSAQMGSMGELYRGQQAFSGASDAARNQAAANAQAEADRDQKSAMGYLNAGATAGVGLLSSDERAKQNIRDVPPDAVDAFLADLEAKRFRYRNGIEDSAPGERFGVMAQDVERSPMGASMVREGPDGLKKLDGSQGIGVILASLGRLNERINALTGKGK